MLYLLSKIHKRVKIPEVNSRLSREYLSRQIKSLVCMKTAVVVRLRTYYFKTSVILARWLKYYINYSVLKWPVIIEVVHIKLAGIGERYINIAAIAQLTAHCYQLVPKYVLLLLKITKYCRVLVQVFPKVDNPSERYILLIP